MKETHKAIVSNRRAYHDFFIEDRYEAGLVLKGVEVKSIREAKATIAEAYVTVSDGEAWIIGMHVSPYTQASTHETVDPARPRKLLLKSEELHRIEIKSTQKGYTIVPLKIYFLRGYAKLEIGLAKGKQQHDKRHDMAERQSRRDVDRELKGR